jgi:hypothetical protein
MELCLKHGSFQHARMHGFSELNKFRGTMTRASECSQTFASVNEIYLYGSSR